jgi:hypothetical protein
MLCRLNSDAILMRLLFLCYRVVNWAGQKGAMDGKENPGERSAKQTEQLNYHFTMSRSSPFDTIEAGDLWLHFISSGSNQQKVREQVVVQP